MTTNTVNMNEQTAALLLHAQVWICDGNQPLTGSAFAAFVLFGRYPDLSAVLANSKVGDIIQDGKSTYKRTR